jgi:hypothetical protein
MLRWRHALGRPWHELRDVSTIISNAVARARFSFDAYRSHFQKGFDKLRNRISGPVLCSDCFVDHGLTIEARKLGHRSRRTCRNCHSVAGAKLYQDEIEEVARRFFVYGTRIRSEFGGAPVLQFNSWHAGRPEVRFPKWLDADARLIEATLNVGLFYYGPPLWRLGEIETLNDLREPATQGTAAATLVGRFPRRMLDQGSSFYRLRKNITNGMHCDHRQYDAPPKGLAGGNRLDTLDLSVLYGSQDLEICVHECRVTKSDECYLAILQASQDLKLLDLCGEVDNDGSTPFHSLYLAVQLIFAAEEQSYHITRAIALAAKNAGLDGIIYPSYFSSLRKDRIPNIALFGHPVIDGTVKVICINRLTLETARYTMQLGPCLRPPRKGP